MKKGVLFTYLAVGLAALSAVLHNVVYAIWQIEEAVFFILTLVLFVAFIFLLIYNTITYITKGKPKDLWKLAFLGLVGLLGLTGNFGLFGFFGFFGFFGLKRRFFK